MKYTIKYEFANNNNSTYLTIPINEEIKENESLGDLIGFYKEVGGLEFDELIDIDNEDVRDFIKDNFKDYRSVLGFIRIITE